MSFLVHYRLWRRQWRAIGDNAEMRYWWALIGGFVALILIERLAGAKGIRAGLSWRRLEEHPEDVDQLDHGVRRSSGWCSSRWSPS